MNLLDDTDHKDPVEIDPNKDYFAELTGPGGKFDRTKYESDSDMYKAIARGKVEADKYVDHLKARHDELRQDWSKLREEYNAGPKLKEYLDQLVARQSQNDHVTPLVEDVKQPVFDPNEIEKILETKLSAREQLRKEEANYKLVESKLTEHYGSNYQSVLKQQVDQLGLDKDFVNELARKHPSVLFRTLGLDGKKVDNFQVPPMSSQRIDPFAPTTKRTNAYYQKLRKENPTAYRSPKIQDQMFKDAVALGDEFNDGDWNAYGH